MNEMLLTLVAVTPQLHGLLIGFLIIVIVIAVIAGLLWCVEQWISPVPAMVKLVLAIVILVLIVLWALGAVGVSL